MRIDLFRPKIVIVWMTFLLCNLKSYAQDEWTAKKNFPGPERASAVGFSIGNNGYVGLGQSYIDSGNYLEVQYAKDLWMYTPGSDRWQRVADFPGIGRMYAVSFVIGNTAYVGLGGTVTEDVDSDFWAYDGNSGAWARKADFPGGARRYAIAFVANGKAYVGSGLGPGKKTSAQIPYTDLWEYDPDNNTWRQMADMPVPNGYATEAFSIGNKGYVGGFQSVHYTNRFYEFDPIKNQWLGKQQIPINQSRGLGFSIGNMGYIAFYNLLSGASASVMMYDTMLDKWTVKTSCDSTYIQQACFCIGSSVYFCTGNNIDSSQEKSTQTVWQYHDHEASIQEVTVPINATIYPNPGRGLFTISTTDKISSCEVTDMQSKIVYKQTNPNNSGNSFNINLTAPPGMYFIKLTGDYRIDVEKLVVE